MTSIKASWALAVAMLPAAAWSDNRLTEAEARWLSAAAPVVMYAREQLLPLDIIVQPQELSNYAPISMAFLNGRCKLVLSLRGNPASDETLEHISATEFTAVAQAVTAHEVAHCWRFTQGAASGDRAAFLDHQSLHTDKQHGLTKNLEHVRKSRSEEGFADLFGLAWTQMKHPAHYAQVHAWFTRQRANRHSVGSEHDTSTWIKLAQNPAVFNQGSAPFEQVLGPWTQGLLTEEAD
jgi:hypothetical protein